MPAPQPDGDTALDHALRYAAVGIRVLPIKPGHKRPPMASWQHAATVDAKTIGNWYGGLYREHGVGLAMGTQPDGRNLFALDVDEHDPAQSGSDTLAELEQIHGTLPDTVRSITGSGGAHLIFDSGDVVVTNGAAGAVGPGLDVRGAGGQIVVAPTVHPNGTTYSWEDGCAPGEIDIAPAPAWLMALVAPPERQPESEPTRPVAPGIAAPAYSGTTSPADTLRDTWDWPAELTRRGWQQDPRHPDHWTRPGKDIREGTSAVLHGNGDGPFNVFTTDASALPMWRAGKIGNGCVSLSPLAYVAAYDHGGDLSAASRALRQQQGVPLAPTHQGNGDGPVGDDVEESDWAIIDISSIATAMRHGTYEPITPTVLTVTDALPLFYRERINQLFGESGGGKTWIALAAVADVVRSGGDVLFVDYEDTPGGIAERLIFLGLTDEEITRVDYRNPSTGLGMGIPHLAGPYDLAVLDSTGEAMASGAVNPNADDEVALWFRRVKELATLPGLPAVVVLDHVPKDREAPAAYAIGSQRKRAAVTGAAYRVDTIKEPAKGKDGKLKLTVAKDRPGNRAKNTIAAEVEIMSGEGGTLNIVLHKSESQLAAEHGERFRPTVLMERVSRWLEINPDASQKSITDAIEGKRKGVLTAIEVLVDEGWVTTSPGPRGSVIHRSERAYRDGLDPQNPDLFPPVPTCSPPVPGTGATTCSHLFPPLHRGTGGREQVVGSGEHDLFPEQFPEQDGEELF